MIELNNIAEFMDEYFASHHYPDEQTRIRPSSGPVRRLGLALEPWPGMAEWAGENGLDSLFLHRSMPLGESALPDGIGIIASHAGFDERLTLGYNLRLADALSMSEIDVMGKKDGRPCGMIGTVRPQHVAECFRMVRHIFGGYEEAHTCEQDCVTRIAVVGAMNKTLVHKASDRGACIYITGQYRQPGRIGVLETGIGVVIVGHRRSEEWGLRALAGVLRERWATVEVIIAPPHHVK